MIELKGTVTPQDLQLDDAERVIEGYLSVKNVIDLGGDVVLDGCFEETVQLHGPRGGDFIKHFYWHEHLIGRMLELREDDKGLWFRGHVSVGVPKAEECWTFAKDGTLKHCSFAYEVTRTVEEKDALKMGAPAGAKRYLAACRVFEGGPVPWPMNESADISAVKAALARAGIMDYAARIAELEAELKDRDLAYDELEGHIASLLEEIARLTEVTNAPHPRRLTA
jgi:HK97 family phage prohead protease